MKPEALRGREVPVWDSLRRRASRLSSGTSHALFAQRYALSGAEIRNAAVRAASRAALRDPGERRLSVADLRLVPQAEGEKERDGRAVGFAAEE